MTVTELAAEGAGVTAGGVVRTAASLVAMTARRSPDWVDAKAVLAQAESLERRAVALATENARRYAEVLAAFDRPDDGTLGAALERAAEVPLRIAETAHDVALLAAHAAEFCEPRLQPDARAAAHLAAGAAAAAAELVAANLTALEEDPRVGRARELAQAAAIAIPS